MRLLELWWHQVVFAPDRNAISLDHWDVLGGEQRVLGNIGLAEELRDKVRLHLLRERLLQLVLHLVLQGEALIFTELLVVSDCEWMHVPLLQLAFELIFALGSRSR